MREEESTTEGGRNALLAELLLFRIPVLLLTTASLPGLSPEAFVFDKNFKFMFPMFFFFFVVSSQRVFSGAEDTKNVKKSRRPT